MAPGSGPFGAPNLKPVPCRLSRLLPHPIAGAVVSFANVRVLVTPPHNEHSERFPELDSISVSLEGPLDCAAAMLLHGNPLRYAPSSQVSVEAGVILLADAFL